MQNLIDERDRYLAAKIRQAPGRKIVAVVGAGHLPGPEGLLTLLEAQGYRSRRATRDETFTIFGVEDCLARGYERTGFFEVDTQNKSKQQPCFAGA